MGEVTLATEDAIRVLDSLSCSRIKNCIVKLVSRGNMRSLVINNIPDVMNEKDFFLILNKATPNLKRVVIADDSEVPRADPDPRQNPRRRRRLLPHL